MRRLASHKSHKDFIKIAGLPDRGRELCGEVEECCVNYRDAR